MKKILLIVSVLLILVIIGVTLFVLSFDADRYRPEIIRQVETRAGKPVELEKISLGWNGGFSLELKGLAVFKDTDKREALMRLKKASAVIGLKPLLERQLQVSTIELDHPFISLVRGADGKIKGTDGLFAGKKQESGAAALSFLIDAVRLEGGEIYYRDEMTTPPREVTARDLEVAVESVAIEREIPVEGRLTLLSRSRHNVHFGARLIVSALDRKARLQDFSVTTDLDSLDPEELQSLLPGAELSGLSGQVQVRIPTLDLNEEGLKRLRTEVVLSQGRFPLGEGVSSLEGLSANAFYEKDRVTLHSFSAGFAGGRITGTGNIQLNTPRPLAAFDLKAAQIQLADAVPPAGAGQPYMEGLLEAALQGTSTGASGPEILPSLQGQGQVLIARPVLRNLNVLREIFNGLSSIPTLMDRLRERLPPEYFEKLKARDTVFEDIEIPLAIQQGVLSFPRVVITSESFQLQASGSLIISTQFINAAGVILLDRDLTQAMLRSVRELESLTNARGLLEIPIIMNGPLATAKPRPDPRILSTLAVSKAQELIGGLLAKKQTPDGQAAPGSTSPSPQQQAPSSQPPQQGTGGLFGALLQTALESGLGGNSGDSSQPSQQ